MRFLLAATAVLLAGCTGAQPWVPTTRFTLEDPGEAPGLLSQQESPSAGVAGYGLQTLGATELIVRFTPDSDDPRPSRGAFVEKLPTGADLYQMASEAELQAELEALWAREDCLLAEPNASFELLALPPEYSDATHPHLARVGAPAAWAQETGSAAVVVAVVDTGLDVTSGCTPTHPDLAGNVVASSLWINAGGGSSSCSGVDDSTGGTYGGHGTRVAGVIAATAGNGPAVGVAPGCKLLPVRATSGGGFSGGYTTSSVSNAILQAITKPGVKVINLSMGTPIDSPTLRQACDQAAAADVLVVAAAGNNGLNQPMYPAAYDSVLSVTGTTSADRRAAFSNYGPWVKMAAPAENIFTTLPGPEWGSSYGWSSTPNSGTSYAAAMVSGAAALVRSARPDWRAQSVLKVLQTSGAPTTGFPVGKPRRLDVAKALAVTKAPPALAAAAKKAVAFPGATRARITADLVAPGTVSVTYGTDKTLAAGATTVTPAGGPTSRFTYDLSGLTASTIYYYRLGVEDPFSGLTTNSRIQKFVTVAPKIAKLMAKGLTYTASLTWTTTAPVTARVTWGRAASALDQTALDVNTYSTSYQASLTDLEPGSTYYYKIEGQDQDGNAIASKTGTVKTAKLAVASSVVAATKDKLVVKVTSKVPQKVAIYVATEQADALANAAAGGAPDASAGLALEQPVELSGLEPDTTYFVVVKAEDVEGTVTQLKPIKGKTLSRGPVELGVASVSTAGVVVDVHLTTPPGSNGLRIYLADRDDYDRYYQAGSSSLNSAFSSSGSAVGNDTTTKYRLTSGSLSAGKSYCGRLRIGTSAPYAWSEPFFFTVP
ncbi:MAG: S8 family serine peptidase [Candidatus Sericytochromatia bacterium]|nr:S8 family serine peptidase [Candidatus Sericytochromatia bacterium]